MLADRHYMRDEPPRFWGGFGLHSATTILVAVIVGVFALQCIDLAYIHSRLQGYLMLSSAGLKQGFIWQLFTFQFLHGGLLHFFLNALMLFLFGMSIEGMLGRGRFLEVFFASSAIGGLLQVLLGLVFPHQFGGPVLGASAGIAGLLALFCLLEPERTIVFMFIFPMRAITLLKFSLIVAGFFVLVPVDPGVAHAAHLGGLLFGIGYHRWILNRERRLFDWRPYADQLRRREKEAAAAAPKRRPAVTKTPVKDEELPPDEYISKEVDPILDKISAQGIHSLTERERKILDRARSKMAKR